MKLRYVLVTVFGIIAPTCQAAPVCFLGTVPCFVRCHLASEKPTDAVDAVRLLRREPYQELTASEEWMALFTTPFKCLGLNGWRRYHFRVWAVGIVENAATSWDGLRTVDLRIELFSGGTPADSDVCPRFIRAEIVRRVWKHLRRRICRGDRVRIEGELHWDGHGFLEVHPSKDADVRFTPS